MVLNFVEFINATNRWSRNQISKAGRLIVGMVSTSLPKAIPILHSLSIDRTKSTTNTTADATAGTNFSRKDLEDFWYNSEEVWPPPNRNE